jgi:hypothetical protein
MSGTSARKGHGATMILLFPRPKGSLMSKEWNMEKPLILQCRVHVAEFPHQRELRNSRPSPGDLLGSLPLRNGAKYVPCPPSGEQKCIGIRYHSVYPILPSFLQT